MTTRSNVLTAAALSLTLASAAIAQSYLPTHQLSTIRAQLKNRDLKAAIRTALNSEGDSVALDLYASGKINMGAAYGAAGGKFVVEVRRTANGYEVVATAGQSAEMGVDGFTGIGVNLSGARDRSVVFGFPNVEQCADGMKFMAAARLLRLDRAMQAAHRVASAARTAANRAHQGFWRSVQERQVAERIERSMRNSYRAAEQFLDTFYKPLRRAQDRVRAAKARVAAAKQRYTNSRKAGRKLALFGLRIAEAFLRPLERSLNKIEADYRVALADLRSKKAKWYQYAAKARTAIANEAKMRRNYEIAKGNLKRLESEYQAVRGMAEKLGWMYAGAEFKVSGSAGIVAELGVPGVSLDNLGLSASLVGTMELAVRFDLQNQETKLTLHAATGISLGGNAGAGIGATAELATNLEVDATFLRSRNTRSYYKTELNVALVVDMEVLGKAGVGFTKAHGIGRTYTISMHEGEWSKAKRAGRRGLLRSIGQVRSDVTVQDRWISAGKFEIGVDLKLVGFTLGGGATWTDLGAEVPMHSTGAKLIDRLMSGTELRRASQTMQREMN